VDGANFGNERVSTAVSCLPTDGARASKPFERARVATQVFQQGKRRGATVRAGAGARVRVCDDTHGSRPAFLA